MSDPTAALQRAIVAALRADAGVQAAFDMGGKTRLYDIPPPNAPRPYLVVGDDGVVPIDAECMDLAEATCTVHVWSLTDPPGKLEAKAIGAAVLACLTRLPDPEGLHIVDARHERTDYLTDPGDNVTAHGVIVVRFACDPVA